MIEEVLILPLSFNADIVCIPITGFGRAWRTPMGPDSEFGVAAPIRHFLLEQRIPGRLERAIPGKVRNRRLQGHIVPHAARDLRRSRAVIPGRLLPVEFVQFCLDNLAVAQLREDASCRAGYSGKAY